PPEAEDDAQAEPRRRAPGKRVRDRRDRTGTEDDEARARRADVVAERAVPHEERDEPAKGTRPEAPHEAPADEAGAAAVAETRRDVEGRRADRRVHDRVAPEAGSVGERLDDRENAQQPEVGGQLGDAARLPH